MRSGKTTFLRLLVQLVPCGQLVSHTSAAAIYRFQTGQKPTLLLDEADRYLSAKNNDLIMILNAAHTRDGSKVLRTAEKKRGGVKTYTTEIFEAWYPKVIASIAALPETLQDRSIVIRLQRKRPDQHTEAVGPESCTQARELKARFERWAAENADNVQTLLSRFERSALQLDDRAADNWALMLTIAALAGVPWEKRVQSAAHTISHQTRDCDQPSLCEAVVGQIRSVYEDRQCDAIPAEELAGELHGLEGESLSTKRLAGRLKTFGIRSRKARACNPLSLRRLRGCVRTVSAATK